MTPEQREKILPLVVAILSRRAILLVGMILDFALFAWAAVEPSADRLIGGAGFAVLVLIAHWLPIP
ncbi:MAG: hypothetical protein ACYDCJ_12865 [Gammaproteobacteria bacterium]